MEAVAIAIGIRALRCGHSPFGPFLDTSRIPAKLALVRFEGSLSLPACQNGKVWLSEPGPCLNEQSQIGLALALPS